MAFADVVDSTEFGVLPRRAEVLAACASRGLPEPLAAEVARNGDGARETIEAWHREGVTAVAAYNDEVALAVLYGIREAGLSCPGDIAVIGCDDIPAASVAYPPLSTISIDLSAVDWVVGSVLHVLGLAEAPPTAEVPPLSARRRATT
ncbi:LacI family transcriptional regulator [Tessaracoccus sp. HDW20]|nr:LacI family transcriptional regulator [Tessaracoccus coleopterorum]